MTQQVTTPDCQYPENGVVDYGGSSDCSVRRPDGERRPRRRQIMGLAERTGRRGRFSAAPDPHQPADQRDPAEAWSIVQYPDSTAVTDSHHPAAWAGRLHLAGLDGEHQAPLSSTSTSRTCMSGTSKAWVHQRAPKPHMG
jgi:hypothetical protein